MVTEEQKFPSEIVDLPSKGKLYPADSPLSSGKVEMKYMTAKEEDLLTNQNYIERGVVIDKLLQALIVDKNINYGDLLVGDKNALLIAARILSYGKSYEYEFGGKTQVVDLSTLQLKELDPVIENATTNEFEFELPNSGIKVTFKLLTHADEQIIDQEVRGLKRLSKDSSPEASTRLKHIITSVDGNRDTKFIRDFVDNRMLAMDSRALRKYINKIQPDVDMRFYPEDGPEGGVQVPITVQFFWPDFSE